MVDGPFYLFKQGKKPGEYFEAKLVRTLSILLESVQLRRSHFIFIGFESTDFFGILAGVRRGNLVHTKVMLLKMTLCVSRRWGS